MSAARHALPLASILFVVLLGCQFPKPADTEPGDDDSSGSESSAPAETPPDCDKADKGDVVGAITNSDTVNRFAAVEDKRCERAQRTRQTQLQSQQVDLQKRELQLQEQQQAEQNDQKLLDQLKALCDDGNDKACKALDFATRKRGCCAWHQGARSCDDDHHVVCFDGQVSQCAC